MRPLLCCVLLLIAIFTALVLPQAEEQPSEPTPCPKLGCNAAGHCVSVATETMCLYRLLPSGLCVCEGTSPC